MSDISPETSKVIDSLTEAGYRPPEPSQDTGSLPPGKGVWVFPHHQSFSQVFNNVNRTYRWSFDEALKHSKTNALAAYRDPVVWEALNSRQLPTAQLAWHLEPRDDTDNLQVEATKGLTEIIEEIPRRQQLFKYLLDALWFGRYASQLIYQWDFSTGSKRMVIRDHRPVNGDKLVFKFGGRPGVLVHHEYEGDWEITDRGRAHFLSPVEREQFVIHHHEPSDADFFEGELAGGVYGVGLRSRIYWLWFIKHQVLSWMLEYLERVGAGGFTIYYYLAGDPSSLNEVKEAAEANARGNEILFPRFRDTKEGGPGIERVEPGTAGAALLESLITNYFDATIRRAILGQELTSETAPTGLGSGVADLHADTFIRIVKYDAVNLQETIQNDLVRVLAKYNYPGVPVPRFMFDVDKPNASEVLESAKAFWEMGGQLDEDELRSVLGLAKPKPGAAFLANMPPSPSPAGFGVLPQGVPLAGQPGPVPINQPGSPTPPGPEGAGPIQARRRGKVKKYSKEDEAGFHKALDRNPQDWDTRRVYGDWLEENGRQAEGLTQKWMADNQKAPFNNKAKRGHRGYWFWDGTENDDPGGSSPHRLRPELYEHFWNQPHYDDAFTPFLDRQSAEAALHQALTASGVHKLSRRGPRVRYDEGIIKTWEDKWRKQGFPEDVIAQKVQKLRAEQEGYRREAEERANRPQTLWDRVNGLPDNEPTEIEGQLYRQTLRDGPQILRRVDTDKLVPGIGQSFRDPKIIDKYRRQIRSGKPLDPLVTADPLEHHPPDSIPVIDGHHRMEALKLEGIPQARVWHRLDKPKLSRRGPKVRKSQPTWSKRPKPKFVQHPPAQEDVDLAHQDIETGKAGPHWTYPDSDPDVQRGKGALESALNPEERDRHALESSLEETGYRLSENALDHLTPGERASLNRHGVEQFMDVFGRIPPTAYFQEAAKAGTIKRGWYKRAVEAIKELFPNGHDSKRFAALLAATSPRVSVSKNLRIALDLWSMWHRYGRPQDRTKIANLVKLAVQRGHVGEVDKAGNPIKWARAMKGHLPNAFRALARREEEGFDDFQLSGPKVNSFYKNLSGDLHQSTNDVWMALFSGIPHSDLAGKGTKPDEFGAMAKNSPAYLAMTAKVRQTAHQLNQLPEYQDDPWTPAEVQETVWSFIRSLSLLQRKRDLDALTALSSLTKGHVADTVDFATLVLDDPTIQRRLRFIGLGKGLDRLQSLHSTAPSLSKEAAAERVAPSPNDILRRIALFTAHRTLTPPTVQGSVVPAPIGRRQRGPNTGSSPSTP